MRRKACATRRPRWLSAPRTVLLPHIGSATIGTRTAMARLACEGVRAVLAGERPPTCLNPEVFGEDPGAGETLYDIVQPGGEHNQSLHSPPHPVV